MSLALWQQANKKLHQSAIKDMVEKNNRKRAPV